MSGTIDVIQGAAKDELRRVNDGAGAAFDPATNPGQFDASDTLAARVWPGGTLAALATPAAAWSNPDVGTYTLSFTAAETAALAPGVYRGDTRLTRGSQDPGIIDRWRLRVLAAPATGAAPVAFTTLSDLTELCPWVEDLQADADEVGFAREQRRATNRLIDTLCSRWRPGGAWTPLQGGTFAGGTTYDGPSAWLREMLTALAPGSTVPAALTYRTATFGSQANRERPEVSTGLLLYDPVTELCARWALAMILDAQPEEEGKPYARLARRHAAEASSLFRATRFNVDLSVPQTGTPWVVIDGGSTSVR